MCESEKGEHLGRQVLQRKLVVGFSKLQRGWRVLLVVAKEEVPALVGDQGVEAGQLHDVARAPLGTAEALEEVLDAHHPRRRLLVVALLGRVDGRQPTTQEGHLVEQVGDGLRLDHATLRHLSCHHHVTFCFLKSISLLILFIYLLVFYVKMYNKNRKKINKMENYVAHRWEREGR